MAGLERFLSRPNMRGLFAGLKAGRVLIPGSGIQQRATYIHGKPPKDKIGAVQSAFVLMVMSLAILGPSGWILSRLDHYKTRD
ncbi:cytochrome c oxidase subunit 8A, mitochondrial-like [Pundamilia nyererei]|uniref:Cytochrome c oxidase subunit 8A, mitochondrial-like n=1 Tax=Pundamilia nyererei TaxID=303518 RepID=A0A9Y6JBR7_9CICH|nr:PREDICTED: cytochrome c oxidase subunit 8A, mitochondrial-like [Pundamilia nyererei]